MRCLICPRKAKARWLCDACYNRVRYHLGAIGRSFPFMRHKPGAMCPCGRKHKAQGLCARHYSEWWREHMRPDLYLSRRPCGCAGTGPHRKACERRVVA